MKKTHIVLAVSLGFSAFANAATFTCRLDSNPKVIISGSLSLQSASIKIKDDAGVLGIRELTPQEVIEMPRWERKKEANYSFAKYYSDFNAWQDLDISVPKSITSQNFKAFLTVYGDNGDAMVPGEANKLSCILK